MGWGDKAKATVADIRKKLSPGAAPEPAQEDPAPEAPEPTTNRYSLRQRPGRVMQGLGQGLVATPTSSRREAPTRRALFQNEGSGSGVDINKELEILQGYKNRKPFRSDY